MTVKIVPALKELRGKPRKHKSEADRQRKLRATALTVAERKEMETK
jgi:hypothetical protein